MAGYAGIPERKSRLEGIPWLAFASLLVTLTCIGASIGIIITSDSQTVESWRIQPAVLLAILASISNVALGIAFSAAVAVTWWISATEGASLAQLHYIWDRGEGLSFFSAIATGANAKRVALTASFFVVVKLATNPLLQRATNQRIDDIVMRQTIKLNVAQYFPEGWFGYSNQESNIPYTKSKEAKRVIQDWWKNTTINSLDAPAYYCDGTCEGIVQGAGIHYNCSSTTQTANLFTSNITLLFAVNTIVSQNSTGAPFLLLKTLHSSVIDDTCTATLTIDTCKIEAGIVEYPIILQNSTVTLDSRPDNLNNATVLSTYIYPEDSTKTTNKTSLGPLTFLHGLVGYQLGANCSFISPDTLQTQNNAMLINRFYLFGNHSNYDDYALKNCALKWSSPTNYVLNTMQNAMFRAALSAANATNIQTFTVRRTKPALVFHSAYGYLAAASAITLFGLLIILIMLQGWWVLGRAVTHSPLEMAKAFGAPLMERTGNNVTVDGILGDVGQIWVKYVDGVMTVHESRAILPRAKEEGRNRPE